MTERRRLGYHRAPVAGDSLAQGNARRALALGYALFAAWRYDQRPDRPFVPSRRSLRAMISGPW